MQAKFFLFLSLLGLFSSTSVNAQTYDTDTYTYGDAMSDASSSAMGSAMVGGAGLVGHSVAENLLRRNRAQDYAFHHEASRSLSGAGPSREELMAQWASNEERVRQRLARQFGIPVASRENAEAYAQMEQAVERHIRNNSRLLRLVRGGSYVAALGGMLNFIASVGELRLAGVEADLAVFDRGPRTQEPTPQAQRSAQVLCSREESNAQLGIRPCVRQGVLGDLLFAARVKPEGQLTPYRELDYFIGAPQSGAVAE